MSLCSQNITTFQNYNQWGLIVDLSLKLIERMVRSPFDSIDGIHLCFEAPYHNDPLLNIVRPGVLRQYFGMDHNEFNDYDDVVYRYTYGFGKGTACTSVGSDPATLLTRPFPRELYKISTLIHDFIFHENKVQRCLFFSRRHREEINTSLFNHATVLYYYGIDGLKNTTKLGIHGDVCYNTKGEYIKNKNSQVENSFTVVLSLFDDREINFFLRRVVKSGHSTSWKLCEEVIRGMKLSHGSLFILHPDDEHPFFLDDREILYQLHHGDITVKKNQFSVAIIFRTVNNYQLYFRDSNLMVTKESTVNKFNDTDIRMKTKPSKRNLKIWKSRLEKGYFLAFQRYN